MRAIFGAPDEIDPAIRDSLERKFSKRNRRIIQTAAMRSYIKWQTVVSLFLLFLVILFKHYLSIPKLITATFLILLSLINTGAMLEQRRWIFYIEYARTMLVGIFIYLSYPSFNLSVFLLVVFGALLFFYKSLGNYYFRVLDFNR